MPTAIVLFSGGLDSQLALRVLQKHGVSLIALNIVTPFHDCSEDAVKRAESFGVPCVVHKLGDEYLKLVANPRFGYGKAVNPCIDCRILMCEIARDLMLKENADFVATGEIVGQRPNSQMMHQLSLIARESRLEGRLVRPLSARVLPPSVPELDGTLDRETLYAYSGRGRKRLLRMARQCKLEVSPQPSTGCLLCEKSFAPRVIDLLKHTESPTLWDVDLLRAGRQLRIDVLTKCVVARNKEHCDLLDALHKRTDARPSILCCPQNFNGPSALLVRDCFTEEELGKYTEMGCSLALKHSNPEKYEGVDVKYTVSTHPLLWK